MQLDAKKNKKTFRSVLFYGVEGKYSKLIKMDMDGEKSEVIVRQRIASPRELALDTYARRIYFFDGYIGKCNIIDKLLVRIRPLDFGSRFWYSVSSTSKPENIKKV